MFYGCLLSRMLPGQTTFELLQTPLHPRNISLANAGVAASGHSEALNSNPAGLQREGRTLALALGWRPAGITHQYMLGTVPRGKDVWGVEIRRFNYGIFEGYDENRIPQGNYSASTLLARLGVSYILGERLIAGISGGFISSRLADADSRALIWTAGLLYNIPRYDLTLGLAVLNNGQIVKQFGPILPDKLPGSWQLGLRKTLAHLPLTLFMDSGMDKVTGENSGRLGGEFQIPGGYYLRFGTSTRKTEFTRGNLYQDMLAGITLGAGIGLPGGSTDSYNSLSIDAAWQLLGPLGMAASFALGFRF